jgi:hypothetical protein
MLNAYRNTESGQPGRFFVSFPYLTLQKLKIRTPNNPILRQKPLHICRVFLRAFSSLFAVLTSAPAHALIFFIHGEGDHDDIVSLQACCRNC